MKRLVLALLCASSVASADSERGAQLQIDGGLSVIGVGYEHPVAAHVSLQVETFVFGTYFLPWFDLGEDVKGIGAGVRPTWFHRADGRGFYVSPYLRGVAVDDESITGASGFALTAGVFAGWAFRPTERIDVRVGAGAQYIRATAEGPNGDIQFDTPFVAIDGVVGYRF